MRKWFILPTGLFLGFGAMAVAASISSNTQPNVGHSLVQHIAKEYPEKDCGKHGSCSPIVHCSEGECRPGDLGTPVRTCYTDANGRVIRCGPWVCWSECP
jgi:hypothetical protein